jgi:hypothetical protein
MKAVFLNRQRGAALLAMLAVLVLGGMWYLVSRLGAASGDFTAANRQSNAAVLNQAKRALIGYVAHQAAVSGENNPGAFPCPEAPGSFNSFSGTDGKTQTPNCALPAVGRFPWRTIGSEKFADAAGEPLWYVVAAGWSKPGPLSTDNTIINSNCTSSASGLACWTGQLTVDGVPNAAVALIIAPGATMTAQAAAGCAAWSQVRPAAGTPDWRNYLECENATNPADATFVTSGPSGSFNDQVVTISAAEVLPLIEAAVAHRFERELAPQIRSAYSNSDVLNPNPNWPSTNPVLPFAAPFANPAGSAFKGSAATFQGLMPLNYAETSPNSGVACAAGGRCDPAFVAWAAGATLTGPNLYSTDCSGSIPSQLNCTYRYRWPLLGGGAPNESFTLTATASNVGMALRQLNPAVSMPGVNSVPPPTLSGPPPPTMTNTGSATVVLNGTTPVSGSGGLVSNLLCSLSLLDLIWGCAQGTISVPILLFADHPVTNPNDATFGWFLRNKWHEVSYYAVSPEIAPSGSRSCSSSGPITCLQATYHVNNSLQPDAGKQRGLIVFSGRSLLSAARPNGTLSDWLEGTNAAGGTVFALRDPSLIVNRSFNDRIAVIDSNP